MHPGIQADEGTTIEGSLSMSRRSDNHRLMDVVVKHKVGGAGPEAWRCRGLPCAVLQWNLAAGARDVNMTPPCASMKMSCRVATPAGLHGADQ